MNYDLRDWLFDICKEIVRQGMTGDLHQQCEAMRREAQQLPEEQQESALQAINDYELEQANGIQRQASDAAVLKEVLKQASL